MSTATITRPAIETLRDLMDRLGDIPLERIRFHPAPGTATEEDVLLHFTEKQRLCELVNGVLVEKPMGFYESVLAAVLIHLLSTYLDTHNLGVVAGEAGTLRLMPGLVRIPDVAFVSWDQLPNRKLPREPMPNLAPDLAVEVISTGNTAAEMQGKLGEYFTAGVRLVWYVYPDTRAVHVYTSLAEPIVLGEDDVVDGGTVLPGFRLSIREWFERAEQAETAET